MAFQVSPGLTLLFCMCCPIQVSATTTRFLGFLPAGMPQFLIGSLRGSSNVGLRLSPSAFRTGAQVHGRARHEFRSKVMHHLMTSYLEDLEGSKRQKKRLRTLYPESNSFEEGTIEVDETHKVYYRVYGTKNTNAKATSLFLHGGPGAGCFPNHARFFDPDHYKVVLMDQRGCGRSKPKGNTVGNNLLGLMSDIETLRAKLGLSQWDVVLGGSWGVTVALAYAQHHPARVGAMVLRGICTMRESEIGWLFSPTGGASNLNPRGYAEFVSNVTKDELAFGLDGVLAAYWRDLFGEDTDIRDAASRRWSAWEFSMSSYVSQQRSPKDDDAQESGIVAWNGTQWLMDGRPENEIKSELLMRFRSTSRPLNASATSAKNASLEGKGNLNASISGTAAIKREGVNGTAAGGALEGFIPAQAMLTCHYSINRGFLRDGELLEREAIDRIRGIPCIAVQGAGDMICPPRTAFDLHAAWPEMELVLVNGAGHSMYDAGITSELVKATDKFKHLH